MKFTIPGEPTGKGRPRVVSRGGFARAYTPEKTAAYENLVKLEYERQCQGQRISAPAPITMTVHAFYGISKGDSKRRRAEKLRGDLLPTKKPDCDNVLKVIADALNGLAYDDDAQIVFAVIRKLYGEEPRVEVEIETTEGGNDDE
jgi:Holliday junction resolvase RusA-like endonuclease